MLSCLWNRTISCTVNWNLSIAVAAAANDDDPVNSRFARGGEILDGGFGGDVKDLFGGVETYDAFESRDGILAVRRDEFGNLVLRHALLFKGRVGQLLADVVGQLNDESDRIFIFGLRHQIRNIRAVARQRYWHLSDGMSSFRESFT